MSNIADGYDQAYADKLWALLPEVYRAQDTNQFDANGPLRELVNRIGAQAANVRRNIDRLWEDQSIETCDDWVIPYIGALLATNLVQGLDARGQRLDVANTISYRRRKGTVGVLEQIANDLTGWDAKGVEFFRRLGRTRHGLDPPLGRPLLPSNDPVAQLQLSEGLIGPLTRTAIGGLADLRQPYGADQTRSAFDEYFYTADTRAGHGSTGWYNIPKFGVFVWRLQAFPAGPVTPVPAPGANWFTFDPTGRDIPLFALHRGVNSFGDNWVTPQACQIATPISDDLLNANIEASHPGSTDTPPVQLYGDALAVLDGAGNIIPAESASSQNGGLVVCPTIGRFRISGSPPAWSGSPPATTVVARYTYGFSSQIGAGSYDRRVAGAAIPTPSPVALLPDGPEALAPSGTIPSQGTLAIRGSLTRNNPAPVEVSGALTIQAVAPTASAGAPLAAGISCPLIRLPATDSPWVINGEPGATLVMDGLFVSGGDIKLTGSFDSVRLNCCTFDPGAAAGPNEHGSPPCPFAISADQRPLRPTRLLIEASITTVTVARCILGPLRTLDGGTVETLNISESIVQAIPANDSGNALDLSDGTTNLSRCTILGAAALHRADVSECILHGLVAVDDAQHGCVRFSAWTDGGVLPRKYESVRIPPATGLFTSTDFGQPGYAQLLARADAAILPDPRPPGAPPPTISAGADDGSEMGAFAREKTPIKLAALITKFQEYMPAGLAPVIIPVT
jgi:hypothetical protein